MREPYCSHRTIRKQWERVNEWFRDLAQDEASGPLRLLDLIQRVMELGMSLKRQEHLVEVRAAGGEWDKANGYYPRQVNTLGCIPDLQVPRLRHGALSSRWFGRYRRWTRVVLLVFHGALPAAAEVYPWATFQLCCWHHLQTLKTYATDPVIGRTLMREAARCYHAGDLRQVQRRLQAFLARWKDRQAQAIEAFRARLDQTLPYLALPPSMHRWFRTTNHLERLFRQIRSRTKLIAAFDHPLHLERFVLGKTLEVNWIQLPCRLQPLFKPDTII